jgi:hypothetical protein
MSAGAEGRSLRREGRRRFAAYGVKSFRSFVLITHVTQEEKTIRICHRMDANIRGYFISLKKIRVHSRHSMIFFFPARKAS